jgi:hypothetical protein
MTSPEFTVEFLAPETLVPSPANFRRHPSLQREALDSSISEHGWLSAPIVNKANGRILDGHARVELALERGEATIPVRVVDVSEEQERRILRMFDAVGGLAEIDTEALDRLIEEIDDPALERLLGELEAETTAGGLVEGADPDAVPDEVATRCQPGDIWLLGEHRIGCLDCTDGEAVKRLLGDDVPQMVFADPPYGIDIVDTTGWVGGGAAYQIPFGGRKKQGLGTANGSKPFGSKGERGTVGGGKIAAVGVYAPVIGDDSPETAITAHGLCASLLPQAVQIWWGGNHYANALPSSSCWIVWDKENTGNFADAELAWTNQKTAVRIFRHMWNGLMKASERGEKRVHPTQKPVALAEWCFETYGTVGDVVFDPFLGSGMSVIAATKTARRVLGCELSAEYCDVVMQRYENLVGKKAKLQARSA